MNATSSGDAAPFTVDVLVVGYGAAGAAAAITAADAGARVLVAEKNPEARHTPNTRMSGGMIMTVADADGGTDYLDACAGGMVPRDVSAAWAERAAHLEAWMDERIGGLDLAVAGVPEHRDLPGAGSVHTVQIGGVRERLAAGAGGGPALWSHLDAAVRRRPVEIWWESPAVRLLQSPDGSVTGATLRHDRGGDGRGGDGRGGQEVTVMARHGVVLACGGYEFDDTMKRDFLRADVAHFYGHPGNTGDGVRMAQAVGASLWHMNQMIGRGVGHFLDSDGTPVNVILTIAPAPYVITDRSGRRFMNEHHQALLRHDVYYSLLEYDPARKRSPRVPCCWFFDERRRLAGPLTLTHIGAPAVGLVEWSQDNQAEIDRGWILAGSTIAEVAAAAGVEDPEEAERSAADYNRRCRDGLPDPFGRPADTMVPLEGPPYYAVPLWPGGSNTTGGPRRDRHGRVLDAFGAPITGLYAAGELGQPSGLLYPADGSNLSEALCFGQIAVEHALGTRR